LPHDGQDELLILIDDIQPPNIHQHQAIRGRRRRRRRREEEEEEGGGRRREEEE